MEGSDAGRRQLAPTSSAVGTLNALLARCWSPVSCWYPPPAVPAVPAASSKPSSAEAGEAALEPDEQEHEQEQPTGATVLQLGGRIQAGDAPQSSRLSPKVVVDGTPFEVRPSERVVVLRRTDIGPVKGKTAKYALIEVRGQRGWIEECALLIDGEDSFELVSQQFVHEFASIM